MSDDLNLEQFYRFCFRLKFTDRDIKKILKIAEINNGEITTSMLRGYLPIAWSSCERIAIEMENCGLAKHLEKFSHPTVHLPTGEIDGLFSNSVLK